MPRVSVMIYADYFLVDNIPKVTNLYIQLSHSIVDLTATDGSPVQEELVLL